MHAAARSVEWYHEAARAFRREQLWTLDLAARVIVVR